jgi:phosphoribosylglycinamide formyltransferase 2
MSGGRVGPGRIIVEGFIDFDYEITQLTVRALGANGQIQTHFCDPIGHVQVSGDYVESWQPHPMTATALAESRRIAKAVTDDLGVGHDGQPSGLGLFGVELFVKGDKVWFSEVSPRPHDTGMVTMITQWQNEFELHARAILGLPVDTALKSPGASAVIYGGVEAKGIVFDGVDEAMRVPNSEIRLFGKPEFCSADGRGAKRCRRRGGARRQAGRCLVARGTVIPRRTCGASPRAARRSRFRSPGPLPPARQVRAERGGTGLPATRAPP